MTTTPPNMQELIAKAKQMQDQMQKAQREITSLEVTGEAGGGVVKINMNGAHQARNVEIAPTVLNEDEDMLGDLIAAAINDATQKIEEASKQKMLALAKEIKLPEGLEDQNK